MFLKKIVIYFIGSFNFLVFVIVAILQIRFFVVVGSTYIQLAFNNFEIFLLYPALFLIAFSLIYYYYLDIRKILIFGSIGNIIIFIITIINNHVIVQYPQFPEVLPFFYSSFLIIVSLFIIYPILYVSLIFLGEKHVIIIKKTILDLGTHFARLEVREISEECNVDRNSIEKVIKDMIKNQEIFAEYFKSSKTVIFDKRANIDNIDEILSVYEGLGGKESDKLKR